MAAGPRDATRAIQAIVDQAIGNHLNDLNPLGFTALNFSEEQGKNNTMRYVIKIRIYDNTVANCVHVIFTVNQANQANYVEREINHTVADVPVFFG